MISAQDLVKEYQPANYENTLKELQDIVIRAALSNKKYVDFVFLEEYRVKLQSVLDKAGYSYEYLDARGNQIALKISWRHI